MARLRATSLRTNSGSSFSGLATYYISSVIAPSFARCICDMLRLPFALACAASRFSLQLSRNAMGPLLRCPVRRRRQCKTQPLAHQKTPKPLFSRPPNRTTRIVRWNWNDTSFLLAELKCMIEKRRKKVAARLNGAASGEID